MVFEKSTDKKYVPIRPICEILGLDFSAQRQKIERDEILGSSVVMTTTVGADGKQREMYCLPLKFIFGWLFTIDTSRVNSEVRPTVVAYKLECYNALYEYFSEYSEFVETRGRAIENI